MADVNTKLANALISHMLSLQRLENGAVKRLMETLRDAKKDIRKILDASSSQIPTGTDVFGIMTPFQRQRLEDTIAEIDQVLRIATLKLNNELTTSLTALAGNETEILAAILNRQIPDSLGLKLTFDRLPLDVIQQMVDTPLGGLTYSERLRRTYGDALDRIKASLTDSLIQGNTIKQAAAAVAEVLNDTLRNRAEMIARTEMARVATQAHFVFFKSNERFISKLVWISSLDLKVCIQCARLHGKEFPIDTKVRPPIHPNCRCIYNTKLKSAKELGIDDDEIPEFAKRALDGSKPQIPMDFNEWLKGLTDEQQLAILGRSRFNLFKQGIKIQDMASDSRILTLDELRALDLSVVADEAGGLEQALNSIEKEIANKNVESLYVLDPKTGQQILFKTGARDWVETTSAEDALIKFKGYVVTHNHPSIYTANELKQLTYSPEGIELILKNNKTLSFSSNDILAAHSWELSEIRAVGSDYTYSLRPPIGETTFHAYKYYDIKALVREVEEEVRNRYIDRDFSKPEVQLDLFNNMWHDIWTDTAERLDWRYTRTKT